MSCQSGPEGVPLGEKDEDVRDEAVGETGSRDESRGSSSAYDRLAAGGRERKPVASRRRAMRVVLWDEM